MPRHDDHFHPEPTRPPQPPPDAALGGAGDTDAREHRLTAADRVPGDASIERRHGADPRYTGPERRVARR
jgi:hypothetical protein